jgi:hypothetical protein
VTETGPVRRLLDQIEGLELFKVVDRLGDDWGQLSPPDEAPHTTEVDPPLAEPSRPSLRSIF